MVNKFFFQKRIMRVVVIKCGFTCYMKIFGEFILEPNKTGENIWSGLTAVEGDLED